MAKRSDTSPEVERLVTEGYRQMPVWRKMQLVAEAYTGARRMHAAGHRLRNPSATDAEINRAWALMTFGPGPWIDRMEFATMSTQPEYVEPIKFFLGVLSAMGIPYAFGGSFASSTHGHPRFTQDADITVEPFPGREEEFASRFPPKQYYCDAGMVRDAITRQASFNILHHPTLFKIDVFIRKDRPFDIVMFGRRVQATVLGPNEGLYDVVSPEDVILLKLEWYRLGDCISDQQWNDIQRVMTNQSDRLDLAYLHHWADELGVGDLLARALAEAGLTPF